MSRHELELQKSIAELIVSMGGVARICTQTPYTVVGDPDVYGCYKGRMLQFEVKWEKERPTPIQVLRLREWKRAGAVSMKVNSLAQVKKILEAL